MIGLEVHNFHLRKKALNERPSNGNVFQVFEHVINGTTYYVIKKYYFGPPYSCDWLLQGTIKSYENMSKGDVLTLCADMNRIHKEEVTRNKLTNAIEKTPGTRITE